MTYPRLLRLRRRLVLVALRAYMASLLRMAVARVLLVVTWVSMVEIVHLVGSLVYSSWPFFPSRNLEKLIWPPFKLI